MRFWQLISLLTTLVAIMWPIPIWSLICIILGLLNFSGAETLAQQPTPSTLPLTITVLYFDQSSPLLRPNVKTMLDSIARQLMDQPTLMAAVTGYTDAVGKRELNRALAQQRACAVERYLKGRGVPTNRMKIGWEGPDPKAAPDDLGSVKTISRRVVVQVYPR